ncbi:pyruvate kinase [Rhizobium petrolearium]|uniref:pyruvate kinase n=1 Tax=Neorhizobium petrolearium TaxID=515361 RepID=UPI001AE282EE|nr:pyruvate kinase [Neorhizobium petrolearium]MBP1846666.1 pyruvate kinase [Neorhizobium petrolearium]
MPHAVENASALADELLALRKDIIEQAVPMLAGLAGAGQMAEEKRAGLENLCHYLALRHHDLRPLQRKLMWRGLSSLGRLESRVLPTIDAVLAALAAICGTNPAFPPPSEERFFLGESLLRQAADELFGPPRVHRRGRIMVTLPSEAAAQPDFVLDLAKRGMDVARINCAHDDERAWAEMARHVRAASAALDRRLTVLMDIAGPKIRTEAVAGEKGTRLKAGDLLRLVAKGAPYVTPEAAFCAAVSLPEIVTRVSVGDRIRYDDGKLEGVVESVSEGEALVRVGRTKTGGAKLKPEKGLNLPDTALGLSPLTAKDHSDLAAIIGQADMLGYSFVSRADDIDLLEEALAEFPPREHALGLIAKIEQPQAVTSLPALIARARCRERPFGVMIARGDLAAEIGFERVAEMQEEILWICEAAFVPTVWATQVLEDLVKTGLPSRGEMTDAAMAARAECVMLNKGPAVSEAVSLLDSLLARMDAHIFKKTPTLRALKSW